MKRYIAEYFPSSKPSLCYFTEVSKSGIDDGVRISFWFNGKKHFQVKFKNGLSIGIHKNWIRGLKNRDFSMFKKDNRHGIQIDFKL